MVEGNHETPFQALERPRAFEEILVQVERAIIAEDLGPGDRLPSERELAETFGVGRSSVREALRVLEMFGVVVAKRGTGPDAGSIVASSGSDSLVSALRMHAALLRIPARELVDLRVLIESYAAGRAAEAARPEALKPLRDLTSKMRETDSPDAFHSLDTNFHVSLGSASGNVLLPMLMSALRGSMEREMLAGYARMDNWEQVREQLIVEHSAIVDAIETGNAKVAEKALEKHILRFYGTVLSQ